MAFVAGHKAAAKWTTEQDEILRDCFDKNMSGSETAAVLGVSRNAVIGRSHRLGIKSKLTPGIRKSVAEPRAPRRSTPFKDVTFKPAELSCLRCVEVIPRNLSLFDLGKNDCRWPYGDGPFVFCGHPKLPGFSYCGPHTALSIGPGTVSERRAA